MAGCITAATNRITQGHFHLKLLTQKRQLQKMLFYFPLKKVKKKGGYNLLPIEEPKEAPIKEKK
ncbi:hypothetical protein GVAV_001391 [Gurleya vavrai]